jgi:hypothetical protein
MNLYNLTENAVVSVIKQQNPNVDFLSGKYEILGDKKTLHGYPLKVVFSCENNEVIVITAYPLKRGIKK